MTLAILSTLCVYTNAFPSFLPSFLLPPSLRSQASLTTCSRSSVVVLPHLRYRRADLTPGILDYGSPESVVGRVDLVVDDDRVVRSRSTRVLYLGRRGRQPVLERLGALRPSPRQTRLERSQRGGREKDVDRVEIRMVGFDELDPLCLRGRRRRRRRFER